MAVSEQTTALIAVFATRPQAEHYTEELRRAGFDPDEYGMITPEPGDTEKQVEDNAAAGALAGSAVGALAGAVATGLVPGIGPVIAAGVMTGVLGGAAAGAAAGGVLGVLLGLGIPEEEAQRYEGEYRAGRTLVVVQSRGRNVEALTILRRCEGVL